MKPEKTMLRKAALLFLIAAMLSVLLASCKSREPEAPQGTAASTGTRAPDESGDPGGEDSPPVEVLPDVDYSAFDFKMLLRDNDYYVSDMYVEEPDASSTQMDQEVFRRNQAVHERLGIQFSLDRSSSDNLDTDALNSILTGMNDYDLIANHGRGMFSYATNGALANWYELEWVDLDMPWWNEGMKEEFTVNGKLWCMSGDLSYQSLGATVAMIMNKKVCRDIGMEYPYQAVLNGEWTFELFEEMAMQASANLNGSEELVAEEGDQMGYITAQYRGPLTVIYSGGSSLVHNDGSSLSLSVYTERHISIFERFFELTDQSNCKIYTQYSIAGLHQTFATGNILFMDTRLYDISYLQDNGMTDYAILPWPKFDGQVDAYYAWCDAVGNCFGVPNNLGEERLERVSVVLEALAADGSRRVIPTFYEDILQGQYAQDPDSYACIDLIKDGRRYDIASYMMIDLSSFSSCGCDLIFQDGHNFTNWWGSKESLANEQIKKLNELFSLITG